MQHEPIGSAHDLLACAFIARKNGDDETAARFKAGAERINALEAVLRSLVADVDDYERVNNLAPSPGRLHSWQSMRNAKKLLKIET